MVRPLCRSQHPKNYSVRHTAPLPINTLKQKHGAGRGAGTPRPKTTFGVKINLPFTQKKDKNSGAIGDCLSFILLTINLL